MSAPIALHECVLIPCNKRRCTYKCTYICIYMYMYYIWLYSSAYAMQLAQRVKRLQALTKLIRVIYPFRRSSRDFFFLFQLATRKECKTCEVPHLCLTVNVDASPQLSYAASSCQGVFAAVVCVAPLLLLTANTTFSNCLPRCAAL